jgi:hypothetical protein
MTNYQPTNPPEPMNNPESMETKAAMTEELKIEFEKLRNQNQSFRICFYLQALTILILTLDPLLQ